MGMYIVYKGIIKNTGQRPSLRRKVLSTFVVWLYPPPPLGSALRRWALPSIVGLCPLSLGSALRRWALPSVIGLCPSPLGYALCLWWVLPSVVMCHRWALHLIVGQWVVDTRGCWAVPVVDGGVRVEGRVKVNHDLRCGSPCQCRVSTAMVRLDVSAGGWEERLEKMNTMKVVFVSVTHWPGPLCLSLPNPASSENEPPTSLWKGEVGCASALAKAVGDRDVVRYTGLG